MLSQETGERGTKGEGKQLFEQDGIRKKKEKRKNDKKMWQKDRQREIVRDINKSRSL